MSRADVGMRETWTRQVRVYTVILEMAWSTARARAAAMLGLLFLAGVSGAAGAFVVRPVVDALGSGDQPRAVRFGIVFLIVTAVGTIVQDVQQLIVNDMNDRIMQEVDRRLMRVAAGAPGLDHLERSEFADRMKQVRERQWIPAQLMFNMSTLFYSLFGMLSSVVLLATVHPLAALLPVVAIPSAAIQFRSHRKWWKEIDQVAPEQRLTDHYLKLATQQVGAKEIRLFGLREHILSEHRRLSEIFLRTMFGARLKQAAGSTLGGLLYGASLTAVVGFIGWLALNGRASIGDVALGVQVARMTIGHIEMAAGMTANLAEVAFMGEKYLWLLRYRPAIEVRSTQDALPAPDVIRSGITLESVSFAYPGTEARVLHEVSLFIPAGSTVALVGENGAGKSSLVKLLCRFYDPVEGRILVDGFDLRHIDLEGWRARTSTAFQDFVRFQLVAREAVGVGDLPRIEDGERVGVAVAFAGADRVIDALPAGLETQLGRQFQDGHDLSEGEWQRVALARGSMRDEPALIILDEPTASLDARAEHDVFERFAEMARPRAGDKPTTVLVSHRFSTVRMAELIVVLHEGRIEEIGSHEELMARGGRYAELFRLQASRYD